jgi:hypothetical protein
MSVYSQFFLNSSSSVVQLELLSLSHPSFTGGDSNGGTQYNIVRNATLGVTVTLEDNTTVLPFHYYPLKITYNGQKDDLDQSFNITFGDLGTIIPKELDNIAASSTFLIKPKLIYRTYRSDTLTSPLITPYTLEIQAFSFNKEGVTFEAKAPQINVNNTGIVYTLDVFPMLREWI